MISGIARVLLVATGALVLLLTLWMPLSIDAVVQGAVALGLIWVGLSEVPFRNTRRTVKQ